MKSEKIFTTFKGIVDCGISFHANKIELLENSEQHHS